MHLWSLTATSGKRLVDEPWHRPLWSKKKELHLDVFWLDTEISRWHLAAWPKFSEPKSSQRSCDFEWPQDLQLSTVYRPLKSPRLPWSDAHWKKKNIQTNAWLLSSTGSTLCIQSAKRSTTSHLGWTLSVFTATCLPSLEPTLTRGNPKTSASMGHPTASQ